MILFVLIVNCLCVVNAICLFQTISKQLEMYVKLLKMFNIPSLTVFCEVLDIFLGVKYHISEWGLT